MSGDDRPRGTGEAEPERLVSDEDYADLMAAQAANASGTLDEVSRARLWKAIEARLAAEGSGGAVVAESASRRAEPRSLWWGPVAAAALVLIGLSTYLSRSAEGDRSRVKGPAEGVAVRLTLYRVDEAAGTREIVSFTSQTAAPGTTLLFKVQTPTRAQIGLVVAPGGGGAPSLRLNEDGGPPGQERLLESEGGAYGYRLEAGTAPTFCAVGAESAASVEALAQEVARLLGSEAAPDGDDRSAALATLGAACATVRVAPAER